MSLLRTHWWKFGEWLFPGMLLSKGSATSLCLDLNGRKYLMAGTSVPRCTEGLFPPSVLSLVLLLSNTGGAILLRYSCLRDQGCWQRGYSEGLTPGSSWRCLIRTDAGSS